MMLFGIAMCQRRPSFASKGEGLLQEQEVVVRVHQLLLAERQSPPVPDDDDERCFGDESSSDQFKIS